MLLFELFLSFFQVGMFSFGGGMACMPLIQGQVVDIHAWMSLKEFTDLITISQMTPGPIAVNSATFVGMRIAGPVGAIVATIGCILPAGIIVGILSYVYYRYRKLSVIQGVLSGLRPAVVAMIAAAGISILTTALWGEAPLGISTIDVLALALFVGAFIVLRKLKVDPIYVMLACGALGGVLYTLL